MDKLLSETQLETETFAVEEDRQFGRVASYYDLLMHDVPYHYWISYVEQLLLERDYNPKTVLEVACGTGNFTEYLHKAGFDSVGVDIAPKMIAEAKRKAQEKGFPIHYEVQDAAVLDLNTRKFELCVSLFDSLNYIIQPERLQMALDRIATHLVPNGLLIFDMNSEFSLMNHFFDQDTIDKDQTLRYQWISQYYPDTRLCCVVMKFWYRTDAENELEFEEEHWQFAYREDEVVEMLKKAGFDTIQTYQAYSLRPVRPTSDRIFYVARRT